MVGGATERGSTWRMSIGVWLHGFVYDDVIHVNENDKRLVSGLLRYRRITAQNTNYERKADNCSVNEFTAFLVTWTSITVFITSHNLTVPVEPFPYIYA